MGLRNRASKEDFERLRAKFGSKDPFMTGRADSNRGFGIVAPRVYPKTNIPEFISDDVKVRAFVLKHFPKLKDDPRQRRQAGRWAVIIQRYWKMEQTDSHIEADLGWKPGTVDSLAQQIRRAALGLRLDGKLHSTRRRGRPKKQKPQELVNVPSVTEPDNSTPEINVPSVGASIAREYALPAASTAPLEP